MLLDRFTFISLKVATFLFPVIFVTVFGSGISVAEPVNLRLDQASSKVDFSFSSQVITTKGQFTNYTGLLKFDPRATEKSSLEMVADPSGVSFGNLPFEQMLLVTSLVQSIHNQKVRFISDSFAKQGGDRFILSGYAFAGKDKEKISLPVRIASITGGQKVIGFFERTGPIGNKNNPISSIFGNASCKGDFSLVFR